MIVAQGRIKIEAAVLSLVSLQYRIFTIENALLFIHKNCFNMSFLALPLFIFFITEIYKSHLLKPANRTSLYGNNSIEQIVMLDVKKKWE